MNLELNKAQYRQLINLTAIASGILGLLDDVSPKKSGYKKQSGAADKLESHLLKSAKAYDCGDLLEEDEIEPSLSDHFYAEKILPIIFDYEEWTLYENLATHLAKRDFRNTYSPAELKEMAKENNGYFGVELYDFKQKYWKEFDEYRYDRLEINKQE